MGKVLLINGSPNRNGCTYTALCELEKQLKKYAVSTELFQLGTLPVAGCMSCRRCGSLGKCVTDDSVNQIGRRLDEFDGLVMGSPVYYGAPSGQLCSFLDRLFYVYGEKMAGKLAAAVVSCRRGGATAAFDRLNKYPAMNNMIIVGSQYWNQIHGSRAEDALKDAEGLQTMRTLGDNMAWLLRCIEAGREAGVPMPSYEKRIATNFIRE